MTPYNYPRQLRHVLLIIVLMALFSAACSLTSTPLPTEETAAATAVSASSAGEAASVAPAGDTNDTNASGAPASADMPAPPPKANSGGSNTPRPTRGNGVASGSSSSSGSAGSSSGSSGSSSGSSGSQPAADNIAPVIASVTSSDDRAYYNGDSCGPTAVTIYASITDNTGVDQVWVNYLFAGNMGGGDWRQATLTPDGGRYSAVINIAQEADSDLQGGDGVMQYQVFAQDAAGNIATFPDGQVYGVEVLTCSALGAPPVDLNPVSISNIRVYPDPNIIYYGPCANEPTLLSVEATIEPLDQIASAQLVYTYANGMGVSPEYSVAMSQLGIGDYAGDIDTAVNAADTMGTDNGQLNFYIHVESVNGSTTDSPLMSIALEYCAGGALPPPPAGGDVSFVNNSSHAIISLVIDGVEMFPAEPLGILPGDSYAVTVDDSSHAFTAMNGWWEFGSRQGMYTFSGNFTPQDGNVTFTDPTVQELLTNWGSYRYFQSSYMGNDGNFHFVGFCLYPDGTFREFDNDVQVDSGTYTESYRDNNTFTIGVRMTGQSAAVDALYYETFALLDVPRGAVVDEYAPDDTAVCP
jgi:hypothetical protein